MSSKSTYPDTVNCALQGIAAVNPRELVKRALEKQPISQNVVVVSIGKAAETMAQGAVDVCGDRISGGVVIAPTKEAQLPAEITAFAGGHPIPNQEGRDGAKFIVETVSKLGKDDLLLCLISGGASALSMCPADGISLEDTQKLTSLLLRSGATIDELNCVRKHIDILKGGRLAKLASPATVITYVLSDVIGDPLDTIASGPTVPDPTTFAQAREILVKRELWDVIPDSIRTHIEKAVDESAKPGDPCFEGAITSIVGNNTMAADAARAHAVSLGYEARVVTTTLDGEARERGVEIAREGLRLKKLLSESVLSKPQCLIYAGETTVTVKGSGRGGRNQELVLAAAIKLAGAEGISIASVGTDGIDGPTDAAGAFVGNGEDSVSSVSVNSAAMLSFLNNNDAYNYFATWEQGSGNGLVITGPSGTNVMDLTVLMVD